MGGGNEDRKGKERRDDGSSERSERGGWAEINKEQEIKKRKIKKHREKQKVNSEKVMTPSEKGLQNNPMKVNVLLHSIPSSQA